MDDFPSYPNAGASLHFFHRVPQPGGISKAARFRGCYNKSVGLRRPRHAERAGYRGGASVSALQLHTIVSAPFEENTYLVWHEGAPDALVIDPGLEPEAILAFLTEQELTPVAFLCTHGHADHIAGNGEMKRAYPRVPLMIGRGDAPMLTNATLNLSGPFGFPLTSPTADRLLDDGETLALGGFTVEVRNLPGHSPGHVVFLLHEGDRVIVFAGDTLMRGTTGRGDFPGGDLQQLLTGIRERLFTLPPDTLVYPGHGPVTMIGHEVATNPVLR